jgi:ribose 5-phosphate isomerase B
MVHRGHRVLDLGCFNKDTFTEYTAIGADVARAVHAGDADFGIVCCNFGCSACAGVSKFKGVMAIACESLRSAEMARKVTGANVLCLGQAVVTPELACQMVEAFVLAQFLDQEGLSETIREFRKKARERVLAHGTKPDDA